MNLRFTAKILCALLKSLFHCPSNNDIKIFSMTNSEKNYYLLPIFVVMI